MKYFFGMLAIVLTMNTDTLYDFSTNSDLRNWRIVDDVVMGGRSNGRFELTPDGHGLFMGEISLENNGGFSSLRYTFPQVSVKTTDTLRLRVKGDGKKYQFRIKPSRRLAYSYLYEFMTTGDWQVVDIPINEMYPVYRGRRLNRPTFDHDTIEELVILFGNKKPETFQLLIDKIAIHQ